MVFKTVDFCYKLLNYTLASYADELQQEEDDDDDDDDDEFERSRRAIDGKCMIVKVCSVFFNQ